MKMILLSDGLLINPRHVVIAAPILNEKGEVKTLMVRFSTHSHGEEFVGEDAKMLWRALRSHNCLIPGCIKPLASSSLYCDTHQEDV